MEVILDNYSAALIFLVFCLGIIFEHRRGYREGVKVGYVGGAGETVKYLMEIGHLNATIVDHENKSEEPADAKTLTAYIVMQSLKDKEEIRFDL
jgi:hypothetical protein